MNPLYGKKLTREEFENQIFKALLRNDTSTKYGRRQYNKEELDITINYRLGVNYPENKRQLLGNLRKKSRIYFFSLIALYKTTNLLPKSLQDKIFNKVLQKILGEANHFMSKSDIKAMFID